MQSARKKKVTSALFLELDKVFDTVWIDGILYSLTTRFLKVKWRGEHGETLAANVMEKSSTEVTGMRIFTSCSADSLPVVFEASRRRPGLQQV